MTAELIASAANRGRASLGGVVAMSTEGIALFDPSELAEALACTEADIDAATRAGRLPGLKFGRRWKFVAGALNRCLDDMALADSARRRAELEQATKQRRNKSGRRPEVIRYHAAKRRAARLKRTPPWADLAEIQKFYDRAHAISVATGIPHHVDHVIPLQGVFVSGLHVPANLQILQGAENSRKHNHFELG